MGSRDDKLLIERCIKGDQTAWKDLITRYQRLVYSVAHNFCNQAEDVSDVFQQVWMEMYQHLSDLRHIEALPAWLITVTRRRCYAVIRAQRGSEQLDEGLAGDSEDLAQIEREHELERALEQLPERCRRLLNLLYFDVSEPSYSEISGTMSMPEASIGPTRARCLEKLRKIMS